MRAPTDPGELLAAAFPARSIISIGSSDRDLHGADFSFHSPHRPDVVVYAESTADVSTVLRLANDHRIPLVPFGAGSSLEGHVIPEKGGISLDMTRMNAILDLRSSDLTATVQAGVTRLALDGAAKAQGLTFPVDPGADATLGGMAATNAGGTTTIRYGKMRANVLALEAVLPGGDVIRTGARTSKSSAGYDLTGLLVGSEGTLAVITELTVRLHGVPDHVVAARIVFPDIEAACHTAALGVAMGASLQRLELVDGWTIGIVNAFLATDYAVAPTLFVEAAGAEAAAEADLELVSAIAADNGATEVFVERTQEARSVLWSARHRIADAIALSAPGSRQRATDVCVPVSELAAAVVFARAALDERGIDGGVFGHAGDGNIHVVTMVDAADQLQVARADELTTTLIADALARGGTCSGEHGIGLGKIDALEREHGDLIALYKGVKSLFDPNWIMNPGKVLRSQ